MTSQSPDIKISTEPPIRAPSAVPVDDAALPFEVGALDLRGRLTRLGPALDEILTKHDYPAPVGKLLGEGDRADDAARLVAEIRRAASSCRPRPMGPVSFLIVDFQAPDRLRAYARYDAGRLEADRIPARCSARATWR